jgi:autotransporter-associated beta strand protein
MFNGWWRRLVPRRPPTARRAHRRPAGLASGRLHVEPLEDRLAPSTFAWNVDSDGNWDNAANWTLVSGPAGPGYPDGQDDVAQFLNVTTATRTVTIPTAVTITVGTIEINSGQSYILTSAGTGLLEFKVSGGSAALTVLNSNGDGAHTLSAAVSLSDHLAISNASAGTLAVTGGLAETGTRNVSKAGTGTVAISGANTYSGTTTVTAGTLALGAANALPTATALSIDPSGTFDLNGFSQQVSEVTGQGLVTNSSTTAATFTVSNTANISFDGTLSGNLALTKQSGGTLTLAGNSTYTGATSITAGTLELGAVNALPTATALSVAAAGTLDLNGFSQEVAEVTGLGTVTNTGAEATFTVANTTDISFDGTISGAIQLTKSGAGRLTLNGTNTYTAATSVNGGTLAKGAAGSVPTDTPLSVGPTGTFDLNGFSQQVSEVTGLGTVTNTGAAATFTVNNPADIAFDGTIAGSLTLTKAGAGAFTLGAAATYTGATNVNAGTLRLGASNVLPSTTDVTVESGATFDLNGNSDTVASLTVNGGSVTIGAGTLTVSGLVTMTAGSISSSGAGALVLGGNVQTNAAGTSATISGGVDLNGATRTFTVADGAAADDLAISAVISGAAGAGILKAGAGTMTLSGANTYSGDTTVNAGTLQLGTNNVIPNTSAVIVAAGAFLDVADQTDTVAALSGSGTVQLGATGQLTTNHSSDTTFDGFLTGAATSLFIKDGTGMLTLSGNSLAFLGTTRITAGTLRVNGSLSGSNVALNGGTLAGGNGTTMGLVGSITASAPGGAVSPGQAVPPGTPTTGILHANGNVTLNASTTYLVQINGRGLFVPPGTLPNGLNRPVAGTDYDQVESSGNVNLGDATLDVTLGTASAVGDVFILVNNPGAGTLSGTFRQSGAALNDGAIVLLRGQRFRIRYGIDAAMLLTTGTEVAGNDVALIHDNTAPAVATLGTTRIPSFLLPGILPGQIVQTETATLNGTLTDPDELDRHSLTIAWGDLTSSPVNLMEGVLAFGVNHTYSDENNATIRVTVNDGFVESPELTTSLTVLDAALRFGTGFVADSPSSLTLLGVKLAEFRDDANEAPGTFRAEIDWGDTPGPAIDLGSVTQRPDGVYEVRGSHTYALPGLFRVTVRIISDGTSTTFPGRPDGRSTLTIGAVAQFGDTSTRVLDFINRVFLGHGIDQNALNRFSSARQDAPLLGLLREIEIGQSSPEAHALTLCELYKQFFDREVDASGLATWTRFLAQVGDRQQLSAILVGSDEFYFRISGGDTRTWLQQIYLRYLRRPVLPSDGELAYWLDLAARGVPRSQIAHMIVTSQEGNFVQIQHLFNRLLGRNASLDDLLFFERRMRQVSLNQIARDIIFATGPNGEEGEFRQRARIFAAAGGILNDDLSDFPAPIPTPAFFELPDPLVNPGLPFASDC